MSLSVSTSRLSNWTTTRSGIVARSIGAMSMSGAAVTSMPPLWIERWRGKPSMRAQNSSQRSQWLTGRPWSRRGPAAAAPARRGRRRVAVDGSIAPAGGAAAPSIDGRPEPVRLARRRQRSGRAPGRPATARVDGIEPIAVGVVARAPAGPQPGDAGRGVARAALVVGRAAARIAVRGASGSSSKPASALAPSQPNGRARIRILGWRRLVPRRDLPDERPQPLVEPAHLVDQLVPDRRVVHGLDGLGVRARTVRMRPPRAWSSWPIASVSRAPRRWPTGATSAAVDSRKNSANPPSASRSRRTIT